MSSERTGVPDDGHRGADCRSQLWQRRGGFPPLIIAHRGSSVRAPENTLSAFRAAIEDQADWVELDVQLASDGTVVVFHDRLLRRTAGARGRLSLLSYDRLAELDCGSWFGSSFEGERIPRLADALAAIGRRACVNIELKRSSRDGDAEALAARTIEAVAGSGYAERVLLSSFDHDLVSAAFRAAPNIERATIMSALDVAPPWRKAEEVKASAIVLSRRQLRRRWVAEAHRRDLAVLIYTVDDVRGIARCVRAGADGIFTNNPAGTRRAIDNLQNAER